MSRSLSKVLPYAVAALALLSALAVMLLRGHSRPTEPGPNERSARAKAPPPPVSPEALALVKEKESREAEERARPRSLQNRRARIEGSDAFTEAEKKALRQELEETLGIVEEAKRESAAAEAADSARLQDADRKEAASTKEGSDVRLSAELLEGPSLAGRPLVINLRLSNVGQKEFSLDFSLAPEQGRLKVEVRRPGDREYSARRLSFTSGSPRQTRVLSPGESESYQTDLALGLGVNPSARSVSPGIYGVRLTLSNLDSREPVSTEFSVTVVAPEGKDGQVLQRLLDGHLIGFLGTCPLYTEKAALAIEEVRKSIGELESLSRDYSDSAYAADIRIGAVLMMRAFRNQLVRGTEAALDWDTRMKRLWTDIAQKDLPKGWGRAELYLRLAAYARPFPVPGSPEEFVERFRALCPTDQRAQR